MSKFFLLLFLILRCKIENYVHPPHYRDCKKAENTLWTHRNSNGKLIFESIDIEPSLDNLSLYPEIIEIEVIDLNKMVTMWKVKFLSNHSQHIVYGDTYKDRYGIETKVKPKRLVKGNLYRLFLLISCNSVRYNVYDFEY